MLGSGECVHSRNACAKIERYFHPFSVDGELFLRVDQLPFSRNYQLRGQDGNWHLHDRFAELPIHQLCYHSSTTTVDELKHALDDYQDDWESTKFKDYLGMTPFHIVATSANPQVDTLECLLDKFSMEMLKITDRGGKNTMIDYLLLNTRGIPLLE